MSGGAGWEWRAREYDRIPPERLRVNAAPGPEADAEEPDPTPSPTHRENEGHRFRSDPRNALREKSYDGYGRWVYADTGTTYNLSEAGYAALVEKHNREKAK